MEPDVRYCTTVDGVRIAYTVTGEGPPLIYAVTGIGSHVQLEWSHPVIGRVQGELAWQNTLIRYDVRGSGLSDRVMQTSVEDGIRELEAVANRTGLERFALGAVQETALAAITFAARHPDRVTRLVIVDGFARAGNAIDVPQVRALMAAAASDFVMATEAIGTAAFGPGRDESRDHGAFVRSCVGPEYFATANAENRRHWDASEAAAQIKAPTLLLRHRGVQYVTDEMTRDLASLIPDSRLVTLDGLWADDPEGLARRIADFINDEPVRAEPEREAVSGGLRTLLFTDITDSTALTQRLGDAKLHEVRRVHNTIVRDALAAHAGTEIKHTGDGIMASFASARGALECATAVQRCVAERDDANLGVHIGLNAGEPIADERDLFGTSVDLASRICDEAQGGEIFASDVVRQLAAGKDFLFADRGAADLKGFDEPVRLFEVRWRDSG